MKPETLNNRMLYPQRPVMWVVFLAVAHLCPAGCDPGGGAPNKTAKTSPPHTDQSAAVVSDRPVKPLHGLRMLGPFQELNEFLSHFDAPRKAEDPYGGVVSIYAFGEQATRGSVTNGHRFLEARVLQISYSIKEQYYVFGIRRTDGWYITGNQISETYTPGIMGISERFQVIRLENDDAWIVLRFRKEHFDMNMGWNEYLSDESRYAVYCRVDEDGAPCCSKPIGLFESSRVDALGFEDRVPDPVDESFEVYLSLDAVLRIDGRIAVAGYVTPGWSIDVEPGTYALTCD